MQTETNTPWHSPLSDEVIRQGYKREYHEDITPDLLAAFKRGESTFKLNGSTYEDVEQKLNTALEHATPDQFMQFIGADVLDDICDESCF
jgi:hypothetical protein